MAYSSEVQLGPLYFEYVRETSKGPKKIVICCSLAELAIEAAISRLAPNWFFPHLHGYTRQELLLFLVNDPDFREMMGGPDTVSAYEVDLALMTSTRQF